MFKRESPEALYRRLWPKRAPGVVHEWDVDRLAGGWWWRVPYGWLLKLWKMRWTL